MHHRTVERLASEDGPVHRLDPRAKLITVLALVVAVAAAPARPVAAFLGPAVLVVVGLAIARLPVGFVLSRTLMVLPFVLLVAVFLPFTRGTEVVWRWEGAGLSVYREGLELCLVVVVKGVLAILAVGWLVFTTPFGRLLQGLGRLRVGRAVVAVLGFLFRYLDLLADEGARVRRARQSRSPGRTVRWRGRSTGGMVGGLLLRSLDRAERVHRSMIARGYQGEIRDLSELSLRRVDVAFLTAGLLAVAAWASLVHLLGASG